MAAIIEEKAKTDIKEKSGPSIVRAVQGKTIKRTLLWGSVSLAAYSLVFLNQDTVTQYFTEGGFMAVVVVITAIAFSIVHGSFAHGILDLLGIEALIKHEREDR